MTADIPGSSHIFLALAFSHKARLLRREIIFYIRQQLGAGVLITLWWSLFLGLSSRRRAHAHRRSRVSARTTGLLPRSPLAVSLPPAREPGSQADRRQPPTLAVLLPVTHTSLTLEQRRRRHCPQSGRTHGLERPALLPPRPSCVGPARGLPGPGGGARLRARCPSVPSHGLHWVPQGPWGLALVSASWCLYTGWSSFTVYKIFGLHIFDYPAAPNYQPSSFLVG